jgi:hypothetical protein
MFQAWVVLAQLILGASFDSDEERTIRVLQLFSKVLLQRKEQGICFA